MNQIKISFLNSDGGIDDYTINNYVCKTLSRNGKYAVLTNAGYDYNSPIVLASSLYNSYTSQWEHQYRYPDVQNPVVNVMDLDTGTMVFSHQWNVPINVDKSVKILSDGAVVYPALDDDNNWAIFKKPLGSARVKIMTLPVEVLDPVSGIKKMNLSDSGELACFEQNSLLVFRGELKSISDSSMNILGVI